jgi:branched-chain amino acid transport system permease protein
MLPILPPLFLGLTIGVLYILLALGLTITFGVMKLFNAGFGAFYLLGAYIMYTNTVLLGIHPILGLFTSVFAVFLIGLAVDKISLSPFRDDPLKAMVASFVLAICLEELTRIVWGAPYRNIPDYVKGSITVLDVGLSMQQVLAVIVALVSISLILVFIEKTLIGRAISATAQDKDATEIIGVDTEKIYLLVSGICAACGAITGAIQGPLTVLHPAMALPLVLKALAIIVLGGMGSIRGTIVGGLTLGVVESLVGFHIDSKLRDLSAFGILLIVLIVRPEGIFGEKSRKA